MTLYRISGGSYTGSTLVTTPDIKDETTATIKVNIYGDARSGESQMLNQYKIKAIAEAAQIIGLVNIFDEYTLTLTVRSTIGFVGTLQKVRELINLIETL